MMRNGAGYQPTRPAYCVLSRWEACFRTSYLLCNSREREQKKGEVRGHFSDCAPRLGTGSVWDNSKDSRTK